MIKNRKKGHEGSKGQESEDAEQSLTDSLRGGESVSSFMYISHSLQASRVLSTVSF